MRQKKILFLHIPPEEEQTGILLWFQLLQNHALSLFYANLLTFLSLLPAGFCLYLLLDTCDLTFGAAALVCLILAGPSVMGLHNTCVRVVHRMPVWILHDFKNLWKQEWKKSMALTGVLGVLWSFLAYAVYLITAVDGGLSVGHLLLFVICVYLLTGLTLFSYQQGALLELPLGTILKNSFLMIFVGGLRPVFAILFSLAGMAVCIFFYGYAIYALLAGLMSLTVLTSDLIFAPIFRGLFLAKPVDKKEA